MNVSRGIHHITAIASDPRANVAFFKDTLGLRLIKKTVNYDDPGTYHLYYGDETGTPGTILTFFPWPHVGRGRVGAGQAAETTFVIPQASVGYWLERFITLGVDHDAPIKRFGETIIGFRDPDDMPLALVARNVGAGEGWTGGPVPAEHGIRGFGGITLWVHDPVRTAAVLTKVFDYQPAGEEPNLQRFQAASAAAGGGTIDLKIVTGFMPGRMGAGSVHHVAFRAADDADEATMAKLAKAQGLQVTDQVDRNYFRSVYFREPAGVLFEIATDVPGFSVDEPVEQLGTKLMLPPWLEAQRDDVEAALPALQ